MQLADRAGVSRALVYRVERGDLSTLDTYARLGAALGLRLDVTTEDPRARARPPRAEDPVHAAIVEMLATRYATQDRLVAADEPFQHYQFAGRADLAVIDPAGPDLLHHEVKTAIANVGELAGAWNVKRQFLARALADRHGRRGFRSATHVLTIAWTAQCLHVLLLRGATIRSLGPDAPDAFESWWNGARPDTPALTSTVILFDPVARLRAPPWAPLRDVRTLRPRHAGYADLLQGLRGVERA